MAKRHNREPPVTLGAIFRQLTATEQAVIVGQVKKYGGEQYAEMHRGMLPFIPATEAVRCLVIHDPVTGTTGKRLRLNLVAKINELMPMLSKGVVTQFYMCLNPGKVHQHFGPHPERGRPMPFLGKMKVTAGLKWSLPKKDYVPDTDVIVSPAVSLSRQGASSGWWRVSVAKEHRAKLELWLIDTCM